MLISVFSPFEYEFFRHGLLAATLFGGLCGLVGAFVVLRLMSYIGHDLSRAVFGGAVVGYVLGWNFYLVAGAWGFISALLFNATTKRRQAPARTGATHSFAFTPGGVGVSQPFRAWLGQRRKIVWHTRHVR